MEEKFTTILDRLDNLITAKHLSYRAFSSSIGVPPMTLSSMLKRRSDPSSLFIATILSVYPDVSPDWLLLGKGEMLKEESSTHDSGKADNIQALIEELKAENSALKDEILLLKGENSVLRELHGLSERKKAQSA